MIYLITGTPGTGKTSYVLHMWLTNKNKMFTFEDGTPRPLFFNHIDGLNARKLKAHEVSDDEIRSGSLKEILPEGAVLIVDECDYIYPLRGPKAPPLYVQTLKELRHYGFTLILITQSAMMLDPYVRRLVATHWHIERRAIGTKIYEFNSTQENLSDTALKLAPSSQYKPDKRTFELYKSASIHIKHKKTLHVAFKIFLIVVIVTGILFYKAFKPGYDTIENAANVESPVEAVEADKIENAIVPKNAKFIGANSGSQIGTSDEDFMPRLPDHPESAPIYDTLRKPVNLQLVVACIKSDNSCNCYSEQATLIKVSKTYCESFVKNGKFDNYRQKNLTGDVSNSLKFEEKDGKTYEMGGKPPLNLMPEQYAPAK
jgi:hypothetical protein